MKQKLKIWHISDCHGHHDLLTIPNNIDIVIHSGDESNMSEKYRNKRECLEFLDWFEKLDIKYKIMIAGNHSAAIATRLITKEDIHKRNIIYLENETIEIEGIKIYGTPYTPTFGNWYFMKDRSKMDQVWSNVPEDTDILISHGPPKGILDLSYDRNNNLERCGDRSLFNHCVTRLNLKLCLFGHIHNNEDIINAGTFKFSNVKETIFSNGSVVTDGKFGRLSSNGNILEI